MLPEDEGEAARFIKENYRGFQDYWALKNQPLAEEMAVTEVLRALGLEFADFQRPKQDPPDCWVLIGGMRVSIEHTELVSGKALRKSLREGERHYRSWTRDDLYAELSDRIARKSEGLRGYRNEYDACWLLIVSDEFALSGTVAHSWLEALRFDLSGFDQVLMALSYEPGYLGEGGIPVFSLRGSE